MVRKKRSKSRPKRSQKKIKKLLIRKIYRGQKTFKNRSHSVKFFLPPYPTYARVDIDYALQAKKYRGWSADHAGICLDGSQGKRCHDAEVAYPRNRAALTGTMATMPTPWPNNCVEDLSASFPPKNGVCVSGFLSHQEQNMWLHRVLKRPDVHDGIRGMLQSIVVQEEFASLLYMIPIHLITDLGDFEIQPLSQCGIWRAGEQIRTENINHFQLQIKHGQNQETNETAALMIFEFAPKTTEITRPGYVEGQPLMLVGHFDE